MYKKYYIKMYIINTITIVTYRVLWVCLPIFLEFIIKPFNASYLDCR